MLRKIAVVLLPLLAVIALGVWLVSREATLIWAVNQAQRSGGKLLASGVSGSLLFGPIGFTRIDYHAPGLDVTAEHGRIEVAGRPLLSRDVVLHKVEVDRITVVQHPTQHPEPAKPPEQLRLPVRLSIDELRVNRIVLAENARRYELGPVVASARAEPEVWSAQLTSLQSALGTAAGELRIGTARPFPLDGTALLTQTQPAYNGEARVSGTLERITIQANAAASEAAATASAVVTLFAPGAIQHLEVTARNLDPQYFHPAAPSASFAADLSVDRSGDGGSMRGALALSNSAPGALDAGKIPLAKLKAKVQGAPTDLALSDLLLDLGAAGKLTGDGRLRGGKLDLALHTAYLNVHQLHGRLHPSELAGAVRAQTAQNRQRFVLSLTQKDGRIDLDSTLRNGELSVKHVRATAAGGSLVAHGKLSLQGDQPFAFKGTLNNFDPSRFGKYPRARINSRFDASGALAPVLQLKANLDVFDSELYTLAAAGSIRWRSKGIQTPDIAIDLTADVGNTRAS